MADDVTVMRAGEAVESRPVAELFSEPSTEYTKRLLASVPRLTDRGLAVVGEDGTRSVRPRTTPDPAAPVLVSARDVRVRYRSVTAIDGVSLDLRRGEVLALVGESGSGKSTLAWALAGLRSAAGGTMRYQDGADLTVAATRRDREVRRKVALVFQNADTSLNPRRSVGSAVRRPLRLFRRAGRRDAGARVRQLFTDVHLDEGFVSRLPGQLSGGQRQRVGIARALAGEPEVVIADEITTALDVSVQASTLRLFDDLRRERHLACLFISHDLAVVRGMADRIAVLWQGRVVEEGPTEAVFERPSHPYTRLLRSAAQGTGERPVAWEHDESTSDVWVELGEGHRYRRWKESV
jgi:peptide/nickel transport system ATP-binding protein